MNHRNKNKNKKYNFCYHNITFMYPMLTKKLYFEGGGEPFLTFKNFQKKYFQKFHLLICIIIFFQLKYLIQIS